ncbi:MAG: ATP-binding protein [Prolixibacteraceae bacterium]
MSIKEDLQPKDSIRAQQLLEYDPAGEVIHSSTISDLKISENEMNTLFDIFHAVVSTPDLYELLKRIHQSLKKVLYAENCFFALYNESTGLFSFPYFVDKFDSAPEPVAMYKSCTAYVFKSEESQLITPSAFKELSEAGEIELVGSTSPSWIGVPLKTSSKTIGVLVLQHYSEENIYSEHHLKFLDSIGSQVANVIERKRAENELEISHSLISATLESTADGILVVNINGHVTNYNNKFIELWRIPESILSSGKDEELLSFVVNQLVDPDGFLNKVKELYDNYAATSKDFIEFKDGRTFERYSQSQVYNGNCVGRVWSFRDITAQKNTMNALHESESQLRELNATKDKFFSIIAHDLKSPFNGILGFSNILADQIKHGDYDNIEEYAEIIQYSSQKAIDLLMNLMEWSRAQSGRMDFSPKMTDIGSILQESFDLLKISALQKSILLTKKADGHFYAIIDKEMILSVLRNLISNSIKFTHPGGAIEIKAEIVADELHVCVSDNGLGMDQNELNKLFRIDESYSRPGTQNEKGTGLGLILCKEFIHKHGGRIWAESKPGKGSRFCFVIPANQ